MTELFISRRAEDGLRQIWRYIAAENPGAVIAAIITLTVAPIAVRNAISPE